MKWKEQGFKYVYQEEHLSALAIKKSVPIPIAKIFTVSQLKHNKYFMGFRVQIYVRYNSHESLSHLE